MPNSRISAPRMPSLLSGILSRAWLSMSANSTQNDEEPFLKICPNQVHRFRP